MNYLPYAAGGILVALALAAMPASADPGNVIGPCVQNTRSPGYSDCYGVVGGCNSGLVSGGIGHSFTGPNDGGGWYWVSVDLFGSYTAAVCENVLQRGQLCVGV